MFLGLGLQATWLKFSSLQPRVETPHVTSGSCSAVIYFTSEGELLGNQTPGRFGKSISLGPTCEVSLSLMLHLRSPSCVVSTRVAFKSTFQFYVTLSFDFFSPKHSCKLERICHPRLLLMVTCLFNPSQEQAEQRRVRSHRGCCVSMSWRFETAKRGL